MFADLEKRDAMLRNRHAGFAQTWGLSAHIGNRQLETGL
jgi:hypothetical protein